MSTRTEINHVLILLGGCALAAAVIFALNHWQYAVAGFLGALIVTLPSLTK